MALTGFTRRFKPLEILTDEQVEEIHRGTLEVLWTTGIRIEHKKALKLFEKAGCRVDYDEMRVRFPPSLVEEYLRNVPSHWHAKARDPRNDLIIGGDTIYFGLAPGMNTIDLDTLEPRVATRKENYDGVKVADALPNLHFFDSYSPYFGFENVPPTMAMLESLAARIRNSTKFQVEGYSNNSEMFAIEMAQAVGIEILGMCAPSPPLTIYSDAVESAFRCAEAGFPVRVISGPVLGATAPATIAGASITNNAGLVATPAGSVWLPFNVTVNVAGRIALYVNVLGVPPTSKLAAVAAVLDTVISVRSQVPSTSRVPSLNSRVQPAAISESTEAAAAENPAKSSIPFLVVAIPRVKFPKTTLEVPSSSVDVLPSELPLINVSAAEICPLCVSVKLPAARKFIVVVVITEPELLRSAPKSSVSTVSVSVTSLHSTNGSTAPGNCTKRPFPAPSKVAPLAISNFLQNTLAVIVITPSASTLYSMSD